MPVAPIACAAIGTPHVCASSTAASISSRVNAVKSTGMPGVSTPPVATILIERAPARICSRTATRMPSAPSACRANEFQPWPPVIVSARPGRDDARAGDAAAVDRARDVADDGAEAAEVAHRGRPRAKVPQRRSPRT